MKKQIWPAALCILLLASPPFFLHTSSSLLLFGSHFTINSCQTLELRFPQSPGLIQCEQFFRLHFDLQTMKVSVEVLIAQVFMVYRGLSGSTTQRTHLILMPSSQPSFSLHFSGHLLAIVTPNSTFRPLGCDTVPAICCRCALVYKNSAFPKIRLLALLQFLAALKANLA